MSLNSHLHAAIARPETLKCLMLSSVNISRLPNTPDRPIKDFEILGKLLQADVVDTENYLEPRWPGLRLFEKLGQGWALAATAVQRSRGYHAILAMSDDVGVTAAALMQLSPHRVPVFMITQHMMAWRPSVLIGKLHMTGAVGKFLCLVPQQVDLLRNQYHVNQNKIAQIDYHVDHMFYHPMPEVTVKRQICSAGMTYRDYATLLRATRDLDVPVKIEAHSAWFNNGVNFSTDEIHQQIEICKYGTSAGLRQLYAESEIVVVPLQNVPVVAGFSTMLEGMAMGKPVIASRINMIGSFIQDGVNGFLVSPENPGELRAKLTYLLENPEAARKMGEQARRTIEQRLTLEQYTERIRSIIVDTVCRS